MVAAPFGIAGASLVRALPGDGAATTLARLLAARGELEDDQFSVSSFAPVVEPVALPGIDERAIDADQTHESVVVGDTAVVKWAVHAEPTPAPDLIAQLTAAGFTDMPRPWGFVTWTDGEREVLVASVMQFLPGASDGWTWAVLDAGDFAARGGALDASVEAFDAVGSVVADMHSALATPTEVMALPTQLAGVTDVAEWRRLAYTLLDDAVASVDGDEGERLADLRGSIGEVFDAMGNVTETTVIAVHGDLHIGQVLRWDGGYAVGDFDGNPVLPVAERLAPQPAARDVAGLLQSIDHVGRVVLRRVEGADAGRVNVWIAEAKARFLGAYRARIAELSCSHLLDDRLLRPFQVEQECREFLYAVRHLPRWRYVPDQALQALFPKA
jgi:maltokinase